MLKRLLKPLTSKSLFLFGPRGAGKSTFFENLYSQKETLKFDLRDPLLLDDLKMDPGRFKAECEQAITKNCVIIVDEIQRHPALLDYIHQFLEKKRGIFALTGSSSRRLKQLNVNFLAGRANVYELFPLSTLELGKKFDLNKSLCRGGLPESYLAKTDQESEEFLRSYALTYLEKEIQAEQWVRNLDPFRRFLPVAAQMNGKILNFSRIGRDVGVGDVTVRSYFEIMADTLMGFFLPSFDQSIRKQQRQAPKFFIIDTGIKRALDRTLRVPLLPQTSAFGDAFEHWVTLEIFKLASYYRSDWNFHYIKTKDDVEIDLIIKRPGKPLLQIDIKSAVRVRESDAKNLETLGVDIEKKSDRFLLSNDPLKQQFGKTQAMHWKDFFETQFKNLV